VVTILQDYYAGLEEKVEIKLHGHATGDAEEKIEK
jgi:sulfate adenylyltransferase